MFDVQEKRYDALMTEYKTLRGEIVTYSQRADTTINIYMTVMATLTTYTVTVLRDKTFDLNILDNQPWALAALLVFGIMNTLVILRLQAFYLAALALAQYGHDFLGPRLRTMLEDQDVLAWDRDDIVGIKPLWLKTRTASQRSFGLIGWGVSAIILLLGLGWGMNFALLWLLFCVLGVMLALTAVAGLRFGDAARQFAKTATPAREAP